MRENTIQYSQWLVLKIHSAGCARERLSYAPPAASQGCHADKAVTNREVERVTDPENILEELPDADTFGGRFSRALDACELDAKQVARRLGVRPATVKGWETDRSMPNFHRLNKIAGLLGVSIAWLLHGVGQGPKEAEAGADASQDVAAQLARLQRLHAQTGKLISQLQIDLDRLTTAGR
jgi:transcriptional regulator with XRE-family HTH domain